MPQIGEFTRTEAGYEGRIRTVTLDLNLVFVPTHNADVENAPDYRIHLDGEDGPEIGAGWTHSGEKAGTYISVALDDPVFVQPIRARLFQSDEQGRNWGLHWSRPRRREGGD
ncbi:DUF736 domain-containing protein [Paracoccus sp. MKU1]|uniref:DUF736 domain-containing protein n=1 Tax=Paracoccus sp. MKU1 TaxID=1745182 RepID=UPI0007190F13|nr:DUF736 domain-containing protein [Paracoccus sp. MKU1]KRW97467.1 hypothetical protein AQY21_03540 [Paracoccus sp. MKU1]